MKNMLSLAVSVSIGLVMAAAIGRVEAKTLPLNGSASGTFVNTESDTNGDGQKGGLSLGEAKSTQGLYTFQGVNEFAFSEEGLCPNGNPGFVFTLLEGTGHFVNTFPKTGDQLFGVFTQTSCFDPITGIQFFSGEVEFTGGTGKYEGAMGGGTFEGTATTLFDDGAGNFFGNFTETFDTTVVLPDDDDDDDDDDWGAVGWVVTHPTAQRN